MSWNIELRLLYGEGVSKAFHKQFVGRKIRIPCALCGEIF